MGLLLRTARRTAKRGAAASRPTLRGHCLCTALPADGYPLQEDAAEGGNGILFRALPHLYLYLPLLHRVFQRSAGDVRAGYAFRHGATALAALHRHRRMVYGERSEKVKK